MRAPIEQVQGAHGSVLELSGCPRKLFLVSRICLELLDF
jgi:hypothetical protein